MKVSIKVVAMGAAVLLVASACASATERLTDQAAEGLAENIIEHAVEADSGEDINVDIDLGDGEDASISIGSEDGDSSFNMGSSSEIPQGFLVPVPDGGTVTTSMEDNSDPDAAFAMVMVTYPVERFDELVEFYADWFDGAGYGQVKRTNMDGGEGAVYDFRTVNFTNAVNDDELTDIDITISTQTGAGDDGQLVVNIITQG